MKIYLKKVYLANRPVHLTLVELSIVSKKVFEIFGINKYGAIATAKEMDQITRDYLRYFNTKYIDILSCGQIWP